MRTRNITTPAARKCETLIFGLYDNFSRVHVIFASCNATFYTEPLLLSVHSVTL